MRSITAFLGLLIACGTAWFVVNNSGTNPRVFINYPGLAVVFGGTTAAIFLSYSFKEIISMVVLVTRIFLRAEVDLSRQAEEFVMFAQRVRGKEIPPPPADLHPFSKDCHQMIEDEYELDMMRSTLEQRVESYMISEMNQANLLNSFAKYPPAFGMIGTVVGLIALMAGLGSGAGDVSGIGSNMAIALTTTLYGLAISNFTFKPMADNLERRAHKNFRLRLMILEGMMALKARKSVVAVQDVVNAFLPASEAIDALGLQGDRSKSAA